jgi:uncharacterized damage-inducible protein DinB
MGLLKLAIDQIVFAREYSVRLLEQTPTAEWFQQPTEGVTHVAWQVGHLAMAEYRLALERIRGPRSEDTELISGEFFRLFGKDSAPDVAAAKYPKATDIRAVFDRVHQQTLRELATLDESELDKPVLKPHALAKTKFRALMWCAQHEGVHAGQIGLLRRLLGHPPLW